MGKRVERFFPALEELFEASLKGCRMFRVPKGPEVLQMGIERYRKGYLWRTFSQSSGSREQGSGATQWPGSISTGVRSAPTVSG